MAVVSTIANRIRRLPGVGLGLARILEMDMAATTGHSARSSEEEAVGTSVAAITKAMRESARAPKKGQSTARKSSGGGAVKSSRPKKAPASKTKRR